MTTLTPLFGYSRRAPFDAALNGLLDGFLRAPAERAANVRAIPFEASEQGDT